MARNMLLWAATTPESVEAAQKNRWFMIGAYRVLAYGQRRGNVLETADDQVCQSLDETERAWLAEAVRESAERVASAGWEKISASQRAFMKSFERELEAERGKTLNGDGKETTCTAEAAGRATATDDRIRKLGAMV